MSLSNFFPFPILSNMYVPLLYLGGTGLLFPDFCWIVRMIADVECVIDFAINGQKDEPIWLRSLAVRFGVERLRTHWTTVANLRTVLPRNWPALLPKRSEAATRNRRWYTFMTISLFHFIRVSHESYCKSY